MSNPIVYNWPATNGNFNEISMFQNVGVGGNFVINGTMASTNQSATGSPQVIFPGIGRSVAIHRVGNGPATDFIVTGIIDGKVVSEAITAALNASAQTTNFFNTVTSVTAVSAAISFSIGAGTKGVTNWFLSDFNRTFAQYAFSGQVLSNSANCKYYLECTLDNVETTVNPFFFDPTGSFGSPGIIGSHYASVQDNFVYGRFFIDDSAANPGTGSAIFTFLQQGIK